MNGSDRLSSLLRQWRVNVSPSNDFARNVWRKIEARRAHPIRWRAAVTLHWLEFELPRPLPALLAIAAVAALAVISAGWIGSSRHKANLQAASERYWASIDPISRVAGVIQRP